MEGRVNGETKTGQMKLILEIPREGVSLAARGLPGKKAARPGEFPVEFYKHSHVVRGILACLFDGMLEHSHIPKMLRRFLVVPLAKACKDPTRCGNKRAIARPSPLTQLLELVLVCRM